jgi:hypothetical protein
MSDDNTQDAAEPSLASAGSASSGTDHDADRTARVSATGVARQALADSSGPTKPARLYFVPPPEMLVDALHDPVGPTSGRRIGSKRFGKKK